MPKNNSKKIAVRFWGVRGSVASQPIGSHKFGCHTPCVSIEYEKELIVCDGGTGVRALGQEIVKDQRPFSFLLSHYHWDHIFGIPFFLPLYQNGRKIFFAGPSLGSRSFKDILGDVLCEPYFPITSDEWSANIRWKNLTEGFFKIGKIRVEAKWVHHAKGSFGFQFFFPGGKRVIYVTDHELSLRNKDFSNWVCGADLLMHDTHYSRKEYATKIGWGHSAYEDVLDLAMEQKVKKLVLYHHSPESSDKVLGERYADCLKRIKRAGSPLKCFLAKEGAKVLL